MSLNKVIIVGRLGKDPELKEVSNLDKVCKFPVATSEKYKDKETTEWHNIVVWGKAAELCAKYLKKGSEVAIEGKIQTRSYDKDGQKKYITEIKADNVQFLGGKPRAQQEPLTEETSSDIPF